MTNIRFFEEKPSKLCIDLNLKTVVFGHHPCPDGIGAIVCLADKFGMKDAKYFGLNHAAEKTMRDTIFHAMGTEPVNLVFADIVPPFEILKEILEKTKCTVTLLDHHATAKSELELHLDFISKYSNMDPPRLQYEIDMNRSGIGIAYDYVHGSRERPIYISLVQAIDLLTATANPEFIKEFNTINLHFEEDELALIGKLSALTHNEDISNSIQFYIFAAIFDLKMQQIFKKNGYEMNNNLIADVRSLYNDIDKNSLKSLLKAQIADEKDKPRNVETIFREQITYQKKAISDAKVIPSLIDENMDILLIEADIQSGRTFDSLIAQKLKSFERPTIAMIVNSQKLSDANWIAIRGADNSMNLKDIAFQYKIRKLANNAGGHPRASALQLSRDQITTFLKLKDQIDYDKKGPKI